MDGHDGDNSKQSTGDMTVFVQNLLQQMQTRFQTILNKVCLVLDKAAALDEMGNRIDELEQSINDLRGEMGQDGAPTPSASLKPKEEPKTTDDNA
ncbi:hypothetical protein K7X08_014060 [Anisodus acutangulus]|uniref:Heat shock factor-binding protein 1 n=1 Tax=Anisodus acutangulus TaxID=402998 RepID=A0A9Q1LMQ9_9SOLA|nr:hypothetical protein K7X08_014060 [Anisodus acutangulus]